ncbi:MAG TPA: hypothetical protein VGM45_09340 [Gaiellaceae bacterium]
MRRLALCLAAAVAALVFVPTAFADGGPFLVTQGGQGVATRDGAFHYVSVPDRAHSTLLEKLEVADGRVNYWIPLKGSWGIPTLGTGSQLGQGLSWDGRTLVLTAPPGYSSPSRFLLVDLHRLRVVRTITFHGFFSFDALSPDGSRMYLIQYTHGRTGNLSHYVVREYDLRTNRLLPGKIAARDEDENEPTMAGSPVTRTTSAGGRWVYTLYQKPSGMPFIHALDTVAGVAHCIDLPWSKTNNGVYNLVLSLRNDDRTLAVNWRSGRPLLTVAVGSWQVSEVRHVFPWAWAGAGIGGGLALLLAAGGLLLRRRRREELEQHPGQELGLA